MRVSYLFIVFLIISNFSLALVLKKANEVNNFRVESLESDLETCEMERNQILEDLK